MSKGIPNSLTSVRKSQASLLVPKGAVTFPGSSTPLPEGVKVRSVHGVQIEFMFEGRRNYETIKGTPTVAHVQAAAEKRQRVIQLIGLGKFSYELEFPQSPRVRKAVEDHEETTVQPVKMGKALDDWLLVTEPTVGPNGAKDYRKDVAYLKALPASSLGLPASARNSPTTLGEVIAPEITDIHVSAFRDWLTKRPGAKSGTTLSYKRVMNLLTPMRGAMERLASEGLIPRNPFLNLKPLKKIGSVQRAKSHVDLDTELPAVCEASTSGSIEGQVDVFTPHEVEALLKHMSGAFKFMVAFWFLTGLRTGELIALRWSDIDWVARKIFVRRSLSRGILKLPKFDKRRWVDLPDAALKILIEHKKLSSETKGWVFLNPATGQQYANESKICARFRAATQRAGVRYRRPYNCRHTYASVMLSAGEPPLYVAAQMGHNDWGMLIKTYGRWIPQVDTRAGVRVDAAHKEHWGDILKSVNQAADA